MRLTLLIAAAFATLVATTPASAQEAQVPLTNGAPPPAVYRLQPRHTLTCLGRTGDLSSTRSSYLGLLEACLRVPASADWRVQLVISPFAAGGATIQNGRRSDCLTVARGVVVGAASLDFKRCGADAEAGRPGGSEAHNAVFDQVFRFEADPRGGYVIRTHDLQCVDVRNSGTTPTTEAIRWPCNGQDNQRFDLIPLGPHPNAPTLTTAPTQSQSSAVAHSPVNTMGVASGAVTLPSGAMTPATTPAIELLSPTAMSVDTGIQATQLDIANASGEGWTIVVPYRFAIAGAQQLDYQCRVFGASGDVLASNSWTIGLSGASYGTLRLGVPRANQTPAARFECDGRLRGVRDGIDWTAYEYADSASATGWVQVVKEAGDTRFWTGPAIISQMHVRVTGP